MSSKSVILFGAVLSGLPARLVAPAFCAPPSTEIRCVNLDTQRLPSLAVAAAALGLHIVPAGAADGAPGSALLVWEAGADPTGEITAAKAAELEAFVRQGGSLLLTLGRKPGVGPMRLAAILPTTAWETQIGNGNRGGAEGPIQSSAGDPSLIGSADPTGVSLSYFYRIRPVDAVERGEARYERYARTIPFVNTSVRAGDPYWTRPLNNREWLVRLSGGDTGHSPLLVTGRYGAGRVAVLAGSLADLDSSKSGGAIETGLVRWLAERDPTEQIESAPIAAAPPTITFDPLTRDTHVTVRNPTSAALRVQLVTRVMSWEPALIADTVQHLTLTPNSETVVNYQMPPISPSSYQALQFADMYTIRLGLLSGNGADVLAESRATVDMRPAVTVSVATDDIRKAVAQFPEVPAHDLQDSRMGLMVMEYAYKPGDTINATITVANGVRNIAPLAVADDETTPNNTSSAALNDLAAVGGKKPIDTIEAYGNWAGIVGRENVIRFTFPHAVHISGMTMIGLPSSDARNLHHNPGAVIIEADGHEVARADALDARFASNDGQATLSFEPITASVVRARMPWIADVDGVPTAREAPWLGEVEIIGSAFDLPKPADGVVSLILHNSLSGSTTPIGARTLTVAPGESATTPFAVSLPVGAEPGFYVLEARFQNTRAVAPILAVRPTHTLLAMSAVHPPDAADLNFIVTRGFRNASDVGTGTQETHGNWEEPDDLVWAYSRRLKQIGANAHTLANRLYVTDSDFKHYSTPWETYLNGDPFYASSTPTFIARVEHTQKGRDAKTVIMNQGDRWDTGPSLTTLYNWQDFVEFDAYLRSKQLGSLAGKTREQISAEIEAKYPGYWQDWQLSRYVESVDAVRDGFANAGKKLVISAQGIPLVPISKEMDLAATIRGMSDDSTWGMTGESIPLTTGREMSIMAFNPEWRLSTLLQWGWNSAILNFGFHTPVGTTEPTRRHYYDRAWRGIVGADGAYRSMHTYGYNRNGGEAFTMTDNDWQEWSRLEDRHSLIYPDGPIGIGLVISSSRLEDPKHTAFSGGGMGGSPVEDQVMQIAETVRRLHEAGVSVPFTANAAMLPQWKGSAPLLLLNLSDFSPGEIASLEALAARGVKFAAFSADSASLMPMAKALLARPGMVLLPGSGRSPTIADATAVARKLRSSDLLPIAYPDGTAGYGFTMQGLSCIEIEDLQEQGRNVAVRLRAQADATVATACEINDHRPLAIQRDGADWVIDVPLRPGDGDLICVKESK